MQPKIMRWRWFLSICLFAILLTACGQQPAGRGDAGPATTSSGSELFESLGCINCHQMNGSGPGPALVGLDGETIALENGESVTVDEQYIRTSILDPQAQIHAGYQPIMPSYKGRVDEAELAALVEYILSAE